MLPRKNSYVFRIGKKVTLLLTLRSYVLRIFKIDPDFSAKNIKFLVKYRRSSLLFVK
jgi:hypothetical protein